MTLHRSHDTNIQLVDEKHPSFRAQLGRKIGSNFSVRGIPRLARLLTPARGQFCVQNLYGNIQGELDSYVERESYIFGGYEKREIDAFLHFIEQKNLGVMLDIGANIGNHSIAFSRYFDEVHAFEPNPNLWEKFEYNCRLNGLRNVTLHKYGLSSHDAIVPFYSIDGNNHGLGTVDSDTEYGKPLRQLADIEVRRGDFFCASEIKKRVGAIKIDVQGHEKDVLIGLTNIIKNDRPFIWFETEKLTIVRQLLRDIYENEPLIYRFAQQSFFSCKMKMMLAGGVEDKMNNYLARPPDIFLVQT